MTNTHRTSLLQTAPSLALLFLIACVPTTGTTASEPSPSRSEFDEQAAPEDAPDDELEGVDLSAFSTHVTVPMMALTPPENPPQPLIESPAEEARLTCEDADKDGNLISLVIEDGQAAVHVEDDAGDILVEEQFELNSVKRDNMPRYWLSGPDIQLAYTSNYGCANNIRMLANAGSDGFRYVFPSCRAHNNMDDKCMRK